MINSQFLKNKIDRQIKLNGQTFVFKRYDEDEYHQVSEDLLFEYSFDGIFHTSNSYIQQNTEAGAKTFSKPQPMILTLYEFGKDVKTNDEVEINNNKYRVNTINDVNNFGVAIEISLELIGNET